MDSRLILLLSLVASGVAALCSGWLDPYYYDVCISIGINIILAVSLNLVNGYTGQFSLGHAGFMAVGAYTSASITNALAVKFTGMPIGAAEVVFVLALFLGGLAAAIAGLAVGIPSLRLRGDYLAIVTLGFGEIIRVLILNMDFLGAARGLSVTWHNTNFFWTFGLASFAVYVVYNLVHSTYGRGFVTVRDDEIAAEAVGINTTKYKVIAFATAAFFAGLAGGLYAHYKQYLTPEGFNFFKSVDIVVMVILGGMGSTAGVVAAAIILTLLPELLRMLSHLPWIPEPVQPWLENRLILYSLLLIILMLTRPQGLFGNVEFLRKFMAARRAGK
ncbi:MAG: branched-chain amino acid ABC transporter permease [Methylacidiphilales bacterium]|nr:branched-chain amino acid ABC transporter permease [Candidatus Methylacidiphilales bacterium]